MRIEFNDDTHIIVTLAEREDLFLPLDALPIDRLDRNKYLVRVNGTDRVTGYRLKDRVRFERVDINLANKTVSRVRRGADRIDLPRAIELLLQQQWMPLTSRWHDVTCFPGYYESIGAGHDGNEEVINNVA